MAEAPPLIVTLELDPQLAEIGKSLRDEHFPAGLNRVPAHVTLFHALPGERIDAVNVALAGACEAATPLAVRFAGVRFLGRGVAIVIDSPELVQLRAELARGWAEWLTPQDRQKFGPHLTVQNKVPAEVARKLFTDLRATWRPVDGYVTALRLWHYRGGPWEGAGRFAFAGGRVDLPGSHF